MAQQPANQSSSVGTSGAAIGAEGERKGIVLTFLDANLVARYHYYWWHNACYLRYLDTFQAVALDACLKQAVRGPLNSAPQ
jgi:hypothetical protein